MARLHRQVVSSYTLQLTKEELEVVSALIRDKPEEVSSEFYNDVKKELAKAICGPTLGELIND